MPATLSEPTVLFDNEWLSLLQRDHWVFAARKIPDVVLVVAVTPQQTIILVEQFRHAVGQRVIELPAGLIGDIDEEDTAEAAARRELEEETGYRAKSVELLTRTALCPGAVNEIGHIFQVHGMIKAGNGGGVDGEDIVVHEVPLSNIREWLQEKEDEGLLIDAKVYTGLYLMKPII